MSIGGLWYPALGYFMLLVFAAIFLTIFLISPFRGRWFCGNLGPGGCLVDFWVRKVSRKRNPPFFRSFWLQMPIFLLLMGLMSYRTINVIGTLNTFDRIGMILASVCLVTTSIAIIVGSYLSPRAWCTSCPMDTVQRVLGGKRHMLKLDEEKYIKCANAKKSAQCSLKSSETRRRIVSNTGAASRFARKKPLSSDYFTFSFWPHI